MKSFMYFFPGDVYAMGPVKSKNMKSAIARIKEIWELKRKNFAIWESDGRID
jgi:hypothetical protein